jgi:hypothetical protein
MLQQMAAEKGSSRGNEGLPPTHTPVRFSLICRPPCPPCLQRAADADEPPELNFIRKHALAMKAQGLSNPAARLFSNPAGAQQPAALPCLPACQLCYAPATATMCCHVILRRAFLTPYSTAHHTCALREYPIISLSSTAGDYGSMVNERVGASTWEDGDELGNTWASRNAFSYGRGGERGTARPEVLQELLKTTDRVVQVGCSRRRRVAAHGPSIIRRTWARCLQRLVAGCCAPCVCMLCGLWLSSHPDFSLHG